MKIACSPVRLVTDALGSCLCLTVYDTLSGFSGLLHAMLPLSKVNLKKAGTNPSKIGSIRQVVILLGLKRLIQMVIAACVSAIMGRSVRGYGLPPGELWRHSIAVSVAAEGLVKEWVAELSGLLESG
jgi:hypothetical protein